VERYLLIASTFCFLAAVGHTAIELRAGVFRPMRFNFFAIGLGFIFQTAFLWMRGQELGRCPITNLFEVFAFLAWSVALVYMLVGPLAHGGIHRASGIVAAGFCSDRTDRHSAPRNCPGEFVA